VRRWYYQRKSHIHLQSRLPLHSFHFRFDVTQWVKNNATDADKHKAGQSSGGLKIAGSGPGGGKGDDGIGVMMSMDKDEATRRKERDAEAEAKRQQNLLPAWHLKSTISGHLTALGVAENARTEVNGVSGIGSTSSSNDEVLRGLGTVGSKATEKVVPRIVEDVKSVVNQESDCELFIGIARSH
jgi:transcription initiation factor TFIIE subunit alpha